MSRYVLAHDLGTTGDKASLYDEQGRLVGSSFHGYDTRYPHPDWAEQDPEDWWRAVCASSRGLLARTGVGSGEIACVSFSGQMMGCVPLDRRGRPLRDAIIWADRRGSAQEEALAAKVGRDEVYRITGHRLSASYSACKILWLRDHQPELFDATHKFVHAKDAMVARLTGVFATDASDASGMNLLDLDTLAWSEPMLEAAQLDPDKLPAVHASTDVVGEILPDAAEAVGIDAGTPVVIGGGDGCCAAAGAGVVREGAAFNYIGASSWIALATRAPIRDPEQRTFTWAHVIPGMYSPNGTMQTAGAAYQWYRDTLAAPERQAAEAAGLDAYEVLNLQAARSRPGANGLVFLPHLLGERSPRWNPHARAAFVGLTMHHTRADMARAVVEGITYNLKVILGALKRQGAEVDAIRLIGGGAKSPFWNQLRADVYGVPVQPMTFLAEATSMGAALVGGLGVGLYSGPSWIDRMNPVADEIRPDLETQEAYRRAYETFDATYRALEPIYQRLADA